MKIIKYSFQQHGDERGQLVAIESGKDVPFPIERIYYMYETKSGVRRGYHAHKSLQQILVCVHGQCKILLDDGMDRQEIVLNKPYEGVYISSNMWREMYDFSEDAVLMVVASEVYNEEDYIRDYAQFLEYARRTSK